MNIAVVGSRDLNGLFDPATARLIIHRMLASHWDSRITDQSVRLISGGARGIDSIAEAAARNIGMPVTIHLPDWNRYGRSAGYRRNELIVRDADIVYAYFADGPRSKGTSHTVQIAKDANKAVFIYHEGAVERWAGHRRLTP